MQIHLAKLLIFDMKLITFIYINTFVNLAWVCKQTTLIDLRHLFTASFCDPNKQRVIIGAWCYSHLLQSPLIISRVEINYEIKKQYSSLRLKDRHKHLFLIKIKKKFFWDFTNLVEVTENRLKSSRGNASGLYIISLLSAYASYTCYMISLLSICHKTSFTKKYTKIYFQLTRKSANSWQKGSFLWKLLPITCYTISL